MAQLGVLSFLSNSGDQTIPVKAKNQKHPKTTIEKKRLGDMGKIGFRLTTFILLSKDIEKCMSKTILLIL